MSAKVLISQPKDVRIHGGSGYQVYRMKYFQHQSNITKRQIQPYRHTKHNEMSTRINAVSTTTQTRIDINTTLESPTMIGKGGYGTIYIVKPSSATISKSNMPMVRKVTPFDNSKEVLHMKRLEGSRNIVKMHSYTVSENSTEIYMEYCENGSIEEELKETIFLSEARTKEIMKAVFQTLAQCHYQDIIHGDVKPDNFLKMKDNRIVAIDFGNAGCERHFEHSKGTPHYTSPEQLRSETTSKSDIWSAGVMMYRLLSGRFPFDDQQNRYQPSIGAIWREIFNKEPSFNEYIWKECSPECIHLIKQLLNKDVSQRPTALDVLNHPWFITESQHHVYNHMDVDVDADADIQKKRHIRFDMLSSLQKDMLSYISNKLSMTPVALSSTPNDTLRNASSVLEYVKEYYDTTISMYQKMDQYDLIKIQGILKKEIQQPIQEEDILQLWTHTKMPLYAFQS